MIEYFKKLAFLMLSLLVLFAILDQFNLTSWLVFPVSCLKGTNKSLTTAIGNTPTTAGA